MHVSLPTFPLTPLGSLFLSSVSSSRQSATLMSAPGDDAEEVNTAKEESIATPMWISLLTSATSEDACTADTASMKIATNNNPCPLHSQYNGSAEYWVTNTGDTLRLKFPVVLQTSGQFSNIGPYFNMGPAGVWIFVNSMLGGSLTLLIYF